MVVESSLAKLVGKRVDIKENHWRTQFLDSGVLMDAPLWEDRTKYCLAFVSKPESDMPRFPIIGYYGINHDKVISIQTALYTNPTLIYFDRSWRDDRGFMVDSHERDVVIDALRRNGFDV